AFVQYIKHREDFVYAIPDHLSFEAAAMNEPLSVGIHALNRAGFKPGQSVSVIGLGPVGLLAIAAAKAYGASQIVGSDLEDNRLSAALKLGATSVVKASGSQVAEDIRRIAGEGVDVAMETAGHPIAIQTAMHTIRRGGK